MLTSCFFGLLEPLVRERSFSVWYQYFLIYWFSTRGAFALSMLRSSLQQFTVAVFLLCVFKASRLLRPSLWEILKGICAAYVPILIYIVRDVWQCVCFWEKDGRSMKYLQSLECSGWRRDLTPEPILPWRVDIGTNTDRKRSTQKTSTAEGVKVLVNLAAFLTKMNISVVRYTTSVLEVSFRAGQYGWAFVHHQRGHKDVQESGRKLSIEPQQGLHGICPCRNYRLTS